MWVKVNARSCRASCVAVAPPRVKTGAETQSPLATVGSVVRMTFPFFTRELDLPEGGADRLLRRWSHCSVPVLTGDAGIGQARTEENEGSQGGRGEQFPTVLAAITERPYRLLGCPPMTSERNCLFCQIVAGDEPAHVVFEDERSLAFLDNRPLFPGHSLLVPRDHHETLADLPDELVGPLFANARLLSVAIPKAMRKPVRSSRSTTSSARASPTSTSTSSLAGKRTGSAASSGRGPSTPRRRRCARSPSACESRRLELLELALRRGGRAKGDPAVTESLAVDRPLSLVFPALLSLIDSNCSPSQVKVARTADRDLAEFRDDRDVVDLCRSVDPHKDPLLHGLGDLTRANAESCGGSRLRRAVRGHVQGRLIVVGWTMQKNG